MICSVARFDVSLGTVYLMFVRIIIGPVKVVSDPLFGRS